MAFIQPFKKKLRKMAEEDLRRGTHASTQKESSGIALLMVIGAISVLSFLVTEFMYVAELNQKLAFDSLDHVKALYLAKSGFKLSLLRLKAFQTVKKLLNGNSSSNKAPNDKDQGKDNKAVPDAVLDKIWSFPFIYPLPTNIPGLSVGDKDSIQKFQNASGLDGSFSAVIESESNRLNLNMILAGFGPSPSPSPSPSGLPNTPNSPTQPSPSPTSTFNPDEARKSLQTYLDNILQQKYLEDPDFQSEYRDFHLDDFMDNLVAWADPTYERKQSGNKDEIPMKRAPFYDITELHMLPGMDDQLYALFTPTLTVSRTPGININTLQQPTLRALIPALKDDEVVEFFKFRDSQEDDNTFKSVDEFYKYLSNSVAAYKGNDAELSKLKDDLKQRNIHLLTDETEFKITVRATVNETSRTIEAWVSLTPPKDNSPTPESSKTPTTGASAPTPPPPPAPNNSLTPPPDTGLRINFMRVL